MYDAVISEIPGCEIVDEDEINWAEVWGRLRT